MCVGHLSYVYLCVMYVRMHATYGWSHIGFTNFKIAVTAKSNARSRLFFSSRFPNGRSLVWWTTTVAKASFTALRTGGCWRATIGLNALVALVQ